MKEENFYKTNTYYLSGNIFEKNLNFCWASALNPKNFLNRRNREYFRKNLNFFQIAAILGFTSARTENPRYEKYSLVVSIHILNSEF